MAATKTKQKGSSKVPSTQVPNTSSTSGKQDSQSLCSVCEKQINDESEESIFCEGICKGWLHRICAGISKTAFKAASESDSDYYCHYCSSKCLRDEIKVLKEKITSLEALHSLCPATTTSLLGQHGTDETEINFSRAVQSVSKSQKLRDHQPTDKIHDTKKFSIVVYGIKECPEGSSRLFRCNNDVKEVADTIHKIDPALSSQSVCDCTRLGRYSTEKTRPILAKLSKSYEVANILANRRKLSESPGISIKPFFSKKERTAESVLLKERWKLIDSGTNRSCIKIQGKKLLVKNSVYGSVEGTKFVIRNVDESPIPFLDPSQTGLKPATE